MRSTSRDAPPKRRHPTLIPQMSTMSAKLHVSEATRAQRGMSIGVSSFFFSVKETENVDPSSSSSSLNDDATLSAEEETNSFRGKEEEVDDGERESRFSRLPDEVLSLILEFTPQAHLSSVARVCKRWSVVVRSAFNEFGTAKSFMHALLFDQSRLTRMAKNPRLTAALSRNDDMLEAVCRKVSSLELLTVWLKNLSHPRWMSCLVASLRCGNAFAMDALFLSMPPVLSLLDTAQQIVSLALGTKDVATAMLAQLISHVRRMCPEFGMSFLVVSCCFSKKDDLLCCLLHDCPALFAPDTLLYILNHAVDHRNAALMERVFASPRSVEIARGGAECAFLFRKLCKLGWEAAAYRLLPPPPPPPPPPLVTDNGPQPDPTIFLRHAAIAGMADMVRLLLARRDVRPGMRKNTIVREAMQMGHKDVVLALVGDSRVKAFPPECADSSLLCCAMRTGQDGEVIERIMRACPASERQWFSCQFNHAPVRLALESGNMDALAKLYAMCPDMPLTRDLVHRILSLIGGSAVYTDMAARIIHDKRFARYFDWNK